MTQKDKLSNSLVDYILDLIGFNLFNIGEIGIISSEFITDSSMKINFDEQIKEFPIYSAVTEIDGSKLNVVAVSIIDKEDVYVYEYEFAVVFKLDSNITYGLKMNSDSEYIFLTSDSSKAWDNINIYDKLLVCAGFENINDRGAVWKIEPEFQELYKSLIEIVDM